MHICKNPGRSLARTFQISSSSPARAIVATSLLLITLGMGCASPGAAPSADPAAQMIAQIDASPPDKRPPSWELTKARMARRPPAFGEFAPDFTLPLLDGDTVTRSQCHKDKPLVLIFGSFT